MMKTAEFVRRIRSTDFQDLENWLDWAVRRKYPRAILGTYVPNADAYLSDNLSRPVDTPGHICVVFDNGLRYDSSQDFSDIVQQYRERLSSLTGAALPSEHCLVKSDQDDAGNPPWYQ